MIQIRQSVFETNSSSMHSLVIRKDNTFDNDENKYLTAEEIKEELDYYMHKDGVLHCYNKDWYFGRHPFAILTDFIDKFKYAFASLIWHEDVKNQDEYKELFNILKKYVPELVDIELPKTWGTDESYLRYWMDKYNISLEEFLTNKKYVIICDGDEYCIWNDIVESGIVDSNCIENYKEDFEYDL